MRDEPAHRDTGRLVSPRSRRSLAPYLLIALVAEIGIWTVQQNRLQDSKPKTGGNVQPSTIGPHGAKGDMRALFSIDDYPRAALSRREEAPSRPSLKSILADASPSAGSFEAAGERSTMRLAQF